MAAALAPYAWREFTDRMLARRVVGAVDRHRVVALPRPACPGTDVGDVDAVEPADAGDERVDALVRALDGQHWRGWSLARLCTDLTSCVGGVAGRAGLARLGPAAAARGSLGGGSPGAGAPGRAAAWTYWRAIAIRISLSLSWIRSPETSTVTLCNVPVNGKGEA